MDKREEEFRKRLLSTFKAESQDHIKTISAGLIDLERTQSPAMDAEIVESIFRATHSLKGASRAVNMTDIEAICQSLEGVFGEWKGGGVTRSSEIFDLIYHTLDVIRLLLSKLDGKEVLIEKDKVSDLIRRLSGIKTDMDTIKEQEKDMGYASAPLYMDTAAGKGPFIPSDTVRVSVEKLGSLLLEAEEMVSLKLASTRHSSEIREVAVLFDLFKGELKKVSGRDKSLNWVEDRVRSIEGRLITLKKSVQQYNRSLNRMVDAILDDTKRAMMLPFSAVLEGFPLLVRNIAREQGKDVDLVVHGSDIEIDRRILEEIKDPLIHIVRNCIDHGIERPEERLSRGKSGRGIISISVSHLDNNRIEIIISDDGKGIDVAKVREAAVESGLLLQAEADSINEQDALHLIFRSGISTSPIVTDISGRGLGLAIAREKVEKLNGAISLESIPHSGTTFRITLPLTIATFRGVLIKVSDQFFIMPTVNIEKVLRVKRDEIKTVENRETIRLGDRLLSFVWLAGVLELPTGKKREGDSGFITALVICSADRCIAFGVDEVLGEDELFAKGLGRQLSRVRNIGGSALPGSGRPVPILNVADLIRSAMKAPVAAPEPVIQGRKIETGKGDVLVVEDSITSRILLKNILEAAGYNVKTAVDGVDAITTLKTGEFDLVVSDIEMPRMNGFDLTAKIREDKRLADLPVVLVTALEKREDREHGIEVGANAYIVKSSFDQGNLLEVIRRLI